MPIKGRINGDATFFMTAPIIEWASHWNSIESAAPKKAEMIFNRSVIERRNVAE